jgi:hypothetical protein
MGESYEAGYCELGENACECPGEGMEHNDDYG